MQLHAITPGVKSPEQIIEKILQIYEVVDYIHIREKSWRAKDYLNIIERVKQYDLSLRKIIINDRIDIALVSHITRVHLASHSIEPSQVKTHFPALQYGCSVHDLHTAVKKEKAGANYLIFGHIFSTNSKRNVPPRGLHQLKQIVQGVSVPVIAIGGMTPDNINSVLQAGAQGIAVMSGIFSTADSRASAQLYRRRIDNFNKEG